MKPFERTFTTRLEWSGKFGIVSRVSHISSIYVVPPSLIIRNKADTILLFLFQVSDALRTIIPALSTSKTR
jgi:hypothetical protein